MKFYSAINILQNELQNARIQNLGSAPSTPVAGQIYYDSTLTKLGYYNGTVWVYGSSQTHTGTLPIVVSQSGDAFTYSINAATTALPGSMSAADKTKLDNASSALSTSTLVIRDSSGSFSTANINITTGTITTTPVNPTDIANKLYVDNIAQGLRVKGSVRAASTVNVAVISGNLTIDGVATSPGQRILLKDQTTASQNGIYVTNAGAWTRSADLASGSSAAAAFTFVEEGTTNADSGWLCVTDQGADVVGTNSLTWTQFSGAGTVTAGAGMTQVGTVLNVIAGDSSITVAPDDIRVKVDGATIETDATVGLRVKAAGINQNHIASSSLGSGLTGGSGTVISVTGYTPASGATVARFITVAGSIGLGTGTTFAHPFATKDVIVQIYDATSNQQIFADVDTNQTTGVIVTANGAATTVRVRITA